MTDHDSEFVPPDMPFAAPFGTELHMIWRTDRMKQKVRGIRLLAFGGFDRQPSDSTLLDWLVDPDSSSGSERWRRIWRNSALAIGGASGHPERWKFWENTQFVRFGCTSDDHFAPPVLFRELVRWLRPQLVLVIDSDSWRALSPERAPVSGLVKTAPWQDAAWFDDGASRVLCACIGDPAHSDWVETARPWIDQLFELRNGNPSADNHFRERLSRCQA